MENTDYEIVRQNLREGVCPDCGMPLRPEGRCSYCVCGFSKCQ